jgi:hypothetical protein
MLEVVKSPRWGWVAVVGVLASVALNPTIDFYSR